MTLLIINFPSTCANLSSCHITFNVSLSSTTIRHSWIFFTMPCKFLFTFSFHNLLHIDLLTWRQNINKGGPPTIKCVYCFWLGLQTADICKSLGSNCTENFVKQWKVSVFTFLKNFKLRCSFKETLRNMMHKHLVFDKSYKAQPDNITKCEREVCRFRSMLLCHTYGHIYSCGPYTPNSFLPQMLMLFVKELWPVFTCEIFLQIIDGGICLGRMWEVMWYPWPFFFEVHKVKNIAPTIRTISLYVLEGSKANHSQDKEPIHHSVYGGLYRVYDASDIPNGVCITIEPGS